MRQRDPPPDDWHPRQGESRTNFLAAGTSVNHHLIMMMMFLMFMFLLMLMMAKLMLMITMMAMMSLKIIAMMMRTAGTNG